MPGGSKQGKYDVVVIGGGHNGLVAASYLARTGLSVLVLERLDHVGGATQNAQLFTGMPVDVSKYSYLVGMFPDRIVDDLGLEVQFRSRRTASYTPVVRSGVHTGLHVERNEGDLTRESFNELTGSDKEYDAWRSFHGEVAELAKVVAPTLLEPLVHASEMADRVDSATWAMLTDTPIGQTIEKRFDDDIVRGVVATDAVIGTFADVHDPSLTQNRTFLYHLIGNGTGEWRVPLGGMGALTDALERAAWRNKVEIVTHAFVNRVESDGQRATIHWQSGNEDHSVDADWVLGNVAPWVLQILLGEDPGPRPEGAQIKVNMLLEKLPRLRSGAAPAQAFAGTFHVAEGYDQLRRAYIEASRGLLPSVVPGELYCHSLTDPSILGPLAVDGFHTMTYFGLYTPGRLFDDGVESVRDEAVIRALDAINVFIEEPIESLLALDKTGRPCLEAMAPQDIESTLAMPGGHIFHGDLAWPWATGRSRLETPQQRWGVETDVRNVLIAGAGAQRGGAVSGIGGHNAAMAVLEAIETKV